MERESDDEGEDFDEVVEDGAGDGEHFEEHDYEVAQTATLPNWVNISDAEHGAYDPAGSKHFDHKAIFGPKPTKGAIRPRRFKMAGADED